MDEHPRDGTPGSIGGVAAKVAGTVPLPRRQRAGDRRRNLAPADHDPIAPVFLHGFHRMTDAALPSPKPPFHSPIGEDDAGRAAIVT